MEAKMSARTGKLVLAASLALAPGLLLAQDRAVPRGGGDSGGGSRGGGSDAGSSHPGPSTSSSSGSSSGSSSSGSGGSSYSGGTSNAERRHPRAGTGTGSSGGYYPGYGYPGYPGYYPGWGGYYPGYGGYWWPYASYGWYGGFGGYGGYGYPGGTVYSSHSGSEGGSVRVLVDPAEARVYVDGYYAGVVDDFDGLFQRLHVSPGRHDISLKLEGYTTHRMRVYVGPDATVKLHYDLQRGSGESFEDLSGGAPPPEREVRRERERDDDEIESAPGEPPSGEHLGQLRLRVEPPDASVYVDGAFRGSGREAGALRLAPGRHRIEVVRPGYRTADQEIEVAPGETTQLSVTLERPSI
jgi:hypothetical protein